MSGLLPVAVVLAALLAPLPCAAECPEAADGFARLSAPEAEIAYRLAPDTPKVGQFFTMDVIACRAQMTPCKRLSSTRKCRRTATA
jgi:hypothetical protein